MNVNLMIGTRITTLAMGILAMGLSAETVLEGNTAEIIQSDVTVITATRSERTMDKTSKSISVITRQKILARNPSTVQEVLEEVPGVSFSRAGGLVGQISMRGSNSNDPRLVLFVDGDRFRGRNTLEYTLFDPSQIERIEVIRGPASALYGPDAMVGVVNIITRKAKGDAKGPVRFAARVPSLTYNSANHLAGGRAELEMTGRGLDLLLGVSGRKAGNYTSPMGEVPNSDLQTYHGDLRLGYLLSPGHSLELSGKFGEVEAGDAGGISGSPGAPLLRLRREPIRESFGRLGYAGETSTLLKKIEASVYARHLYTEIPSENRTVARRLTETENIVDGPWVVGGKILGVVPWGKIQTTLGTDFFQEWRDGTEASSKISFLSPTGSVDSVRTTPRRQSGPDAEQTNAGFFAHGDWDPSPRWTLSAGARVDYIHTRSETDPLPNPKLKEAFERKKEGTETPVTGSLGAIFRPWKVVHFTANVGKAFRAPATFESFGASPFGTGFLVPNPDLESEEALTYEAGFRLRLARLRANLVTFYSAYDNLIVRKPITYLGLPSSQRQNAGKAEIHGMEWDGTLDVTKSWEAFFSGAYLLGDDLASGKHLPYIAPLNGRVGIRYMPREGVFVEGVTKMSMEKNRLDTEQERRTAGYVIYDLYAGVDLKRLHSRLPKARLTLGLENATDDTYQSPTTVESVRYPQSLTNPLVEPGRAVSMALSTGF